MPGPFAEKIATEMRVSEKPHILVGVTSAQTCVILPDRLRALCAAGFRVSLLSGPGSLASQAAQIDGVTPYAVSMGRSISVISDIFAFCRILGLLHRLKPDIVEFSTPKAGLLGSIAAWVCHIRARIYFLRGLRLETSTGFKRCILGWAERVAASCSHVVLCNSRSLLNRAVELHIVRSSKTTVLGNGSSNGVDVTRFSPGNSDVRKHLGIPLDAPVIGFVGRLTADKGVPELLEAFAMVLRRYPDTRLLLVGWFDAAEDALERKMRRRIEGHPRIIHTGYVADAAPYYRAMDMLVLPSWREGFPNAVLEAAASGVPAIATACTGSSDAVVPEVTGLLVPPGFPDGISEAAQRLIADPNLRRRMSDAARQWASDCFDHRRVMRLTIDFYEQLLESTATTTSASSRTDAPTGLPASL